MKKGEEEEDERRTAILSVSFRNTNFSLVLLNLFAPPKEEKGKKVSHPIQNWDRI